MIKLILTFFLAFAVAYADTEFAEPKPDMMNPRKILFVISTADDETIHHVLSVANNVLKVYGPENVNMEIVAYYHGMRALLKKEKAIATRVETLQQYEVTFVACGNTMRTKNIKESDLIDDVEIVTAGVVEMVERINDGFTYIKP